MVTTFLKKASFPVAFFLLWACGPTPTPEETPTTYRFQPPLEQSFAHQLEITSKIAQTFEGTIYESSMIQNFDLHQKALLVDAAEIQVEAFLSNIDIKVFSQQQTLRIRSKSKDEKDLRSTVVKNLLHQPFQINYRPDGSIVSIQNWDEKIIKEVARVFPSNESQLNNITAEFIKTLGAETLVGYLELVNAFLPENGQLQTDSTWKRPVVFTNNLRDSAATMVYSHQFLEDQIVVEGVSYLKTSSYFEPQTQITYAMGGDIKLKITANPTTGIAETATIKHDLKGKATLPLTEQRPEPYDMPMASSTTIVWQRLNQ